MSELLTIHELLAQKLRSLSRNQPYEPSPLTLNIIKANPLQLHDATNLSLKHDGDYQSKLRSLEPNEKVTVENYDVQIKWDKHEVLSVKIQIRELNYGGKKIGGLDLTFQVQNTGNRLVNELGAGYINRLKKTQSAIKFSDVVFQGLIPEQDQKELVKLRKTKFLGPVAMEEERQEIELDETSLKHLKKLRKVINRSDLFNMLVRRGVKDGEGKRTVRHMIFPDMDTRNTKDPLFYQKKTFSRRLVQELIEEYRN